MERKKREDSDPTEQATDASRPTGYIYRGVRYGASMDETPEEQTEEEPVATDDAINLSVLSVLSGEPAKEPAATGDPVNPSVRSVMSEDQPAVPDPQKEPPRPAGELPWWETGSTFGETAAEPEPPRQPQAPTQAPEQPGEDPGEPEADSGPGFFYQGIRYGAPEPELPVEEPEEPRTAPAEEDAGTAPEPEFDRPWWRRAPMSVEPTSAEPVATEATEPAANPDFPHSQEPLQEEPAAAPQPPPARPAEPAGAHAEERPLAPQPLEQGPGGERTASFAGGFAEQEPAPGSAIPAAAPAVFTPAAAPAPAAPRSEDRPGDAILALAADLCPGDLLMLEMIGTSLPESAETAVAAAREDLEQRAAARQPIDAAEYLRLAIVENVLSLHEEAEAHLKEALPRSDRLGPVLNALAVTSVARGRIAPAVVYAREALQETGGDDGVRATASSNLAEFYRLQGNEAQAAEAYETAIDGLGQQGDARWVSRLHLNAGRLHRRTGQTDKARMHFSDAVRLFRDSGDDAGHVQAIAEFSSILTEAGSHDLAVRNLEEGIRICLRTGDRPGAALVQHGIGVAFMAQDQLTRALAYLDSALILYRQLDNRKGEAAVLGAMGKIHESRGDVDDAQRLYEEARLLDNP